MKGRTKAWIVGIVGIMVIMPFVTGCLALSPDQNFINAWINYDKATAGLEPPAVEMNNADALISVGAQGVAIQDQYGPLIAAYTVSDTYLPVQKALVTMIKDRLTYYDQMNQWGTCVKPFSDAGVSDGGSCNSYLDAMNTANNEITADRNNLLNIMDGENLQGQEYLVV
ncbi:MAG: hypothetical protein ABSD81_00370 [Methanomicrobiales archaeon]